MHLRPYEDRDLAAVAELFTASVHEAAASHYDGVQRAAWAPRPPDLAQWRERLAPVVTLLAEQDGRLAGFLSYSAQGHIQFLFTAPGAIRGGVASALYGAAEADLRARRVELLTTEASLVAQPFFARQGVEVVEEQNVERAGVMFRRYRMRKALQLPES
jgi:putative acetyltransferase